MNDYISKPVKIAELKKMVEKWLKSPVIIEIPVLDAGVLADLRQLDSADGVPLIEELGALFTSSTPTNLDAIRKSVADPDSVRKIAHQLKSSSGNFGALRFSKLCEKLEKFENWEKAPVLALIGEIETEYQAVVAALAHEHERKKQAA